MKVDLCDVAPGCAEENAKREYRRPKPSHARVLELLRYEPESGSFFWQRHMTGTAPIGSVAGSLQVNKNGTRYIRVCIDGTNLSAHRLAWFYVYGIWPKDQIDHIDGDGTNNRISNLREASRFQNAQNRRMHKSNKWGMKGITWKKARGKWQAQIEANGKAKYLGTFATKEEAALAYATAAAALHGQFARCQ